MKAKSLLSSVTTLALATVLTFTVGCGEGGGGKTPSAAEVTQLEAKVAQGDGDAAMKLGELFAADLKNQEAQITAAKWFYIAGQLEHPNASMGYQAVTKTMGGDDILEAERRANAFKLPAKE
ncbi:MAG TPA: hypothetical protein DCY13_00440 [Verrucomicrobiales bacterium]|nr:hypothetical protein [Verrucomicrobiales bacterium]